MYPFCFTCPFSVKLNPNLKLERRSMKIPVYQPINILSPLEIQEYKLVKETDAKITTFFLEEDEDCDIRFYFYEDPRMEKTFCYVETKEPMNNKDKKCVIDSIKKYDEKSKSPLLVFLG